MRTYSVCLTQEITRSVVVDVQASNLEDAGRIALARFEKDPQPMEIDRFTYVDTHVSWAEPNSEEYVA